MPKDETTKTETRNTIPAQRPIADESPSKLTVPDDAVIVRYRGGPARGINASILGPVVKDWIYTVSFDAALKICVDDGRKPQFEAVYPEDRTRIEAASKAAQKKD